MDEQTTQNQGTCPSCGGNIPEGQTDCPNCSGGGSSEEGGEESSS